jgi:hypothetical protein
MTELNPYAKFLDGRQPEDIMASTPVALSSVFAAIGPEKALIAPAPGKWSAAEIACHLADCEIAFGFRLRQALAEDAPTVQPFDQEKWAETYPGVPAGQALKVFSALRAWNLRLIATALPHAAGRLVIHPERGAMTFQTLVESIAGHDMNHLGQLRKIAAE